MRRWSKLKKRIESFFVERLNLQIHANVYKTTTKHDTFLKPRQWFLLDGEVIFDFPGQFMHDDSDPKRIEYFEAEASTLGRLADEYFATPRSELLDKKFEEDRWGFTDILKAADRRLGRERLLKKYLNVSQEGAVWKVLTKRFDLGHWKSFHFDSKLTDELPSFENFIGGVGRDDALIAVRDFCVTAQDLPGPLVIIGRSGDGKTHLLRAARYWLRENCKAKVFIGCEAYSAEPYWYVPEVDVLILDDVSHFLYASNGEERALKKIDERLEAGAKVLLGCVGVRSDEAIGKILARWPKSRIVEIEPPAAEQRIKLATYLAPHISLKILSEIAHKSRSMREVGGWIMRYEAAKALGEPFNLNEAYEG
jgi:chromosomal replication initiation ATPase DnaA